MYIVVSCRWRTAAGTHDLWRTEPTNDIRLNQVNRDCVTVTHTHLYINNHSPSTQFIYILFVPFHLSTCRNNPVRVRNIIEVFFFVIISSSYLFKRSRVQQRNSGGKNRKQRRFTVCWLEAQMLLVVLSESGCVFKWVLLWGRSQHNRIRTEHIVTETLWLDTEPQVCRYDDSQRPRASADQIQRWKQKWLFCCLFLVQIKIKIRIRDVFICATVEEFHWV